MKIEGIPEPAGLAAQEPHTDAEPSADGDFDHEPCAMCGGSGLTPESHGNCPECDGDGA